MICLFQYQYPVSECADEIGRKQPFSADSALIKTFTHLQERRNETNGLAEKLYQGIPEEKFKHSKSGHSKTCVDNYLWDVRRESSVYSL